MTPIYVNAVGGKSTNTNEHRKRFTNAKKGRHI